MTPLSQLYFELRKTGHDDEGYWVNARWHVLLIVVLSDVDVFWIDNDACRWRQPKRVPTRAGPSLTTTKKTLNMTSKTSMRCSFPDRIDASSVSFLSGTALCRPR